MNRRVLLPKNRPARRRENHFWNSSITTCLQHVQCSGSIDVEIQLRIGKGFHHPSVSGEMHNGIDPVARFRHSGRISNIAHVEVHPKRINIFAPSETEIIEHAHSHTLLDETRNQVDADKAAASGHQVSFHLSLSDLRHRAALCAGSWLTATS